MFLWCLINLVQSKLMTKMLVILYERIVSWQMLPEKVAADICGAFSLGEER